VIAIPLLSLIVGFLVWRSWAKFAVRSVAKQQQQMDDIITAAAFSREALQERLAQREWDNRRLPKDSFQRLVFNKNAFKIDPPAPKAVPEFSSDFDRWCMRGK
jgi:hypothetical protein